MVIIFVTICDYFISGYWCLLIVLYLWLLVAILLVFINRIIFVVIVLVDIGVY
jgi:hypothetical protein